MLFFYIRHGDPIYNPDSLTPLGERQAEALAKRLAVYGLDKVYASTSNRAILTAKPTCELLKIEPELLDFAHEGHVWNDLTIDREDGNGKTWLFHHPKTRMLFTTKEIRDLADRWFDHPALAGRNYEAGMERVYREADAFFASLGYEHIRYTGRYRVTRHTDERIALFAHQGFGLAFLSCMLDIPYPAFCTHFDICTSGMTVVEFSEENGFCIPKIWNFSSDSHLYREGIPARYSKGLHF